MAKPKLEDVLKRSADGTAPSVAVDFIDANETFANGISRDLVERLIRAGALDRLDLELPWADFNKLLRKKIGEGLIRGIINGADLASSYTVRAISEALGIQPDLTFDSSNPRVQRYVQLHTAKLVTVVTDETKAAIKDVIDRALRTEPPPIEVHRQIKAVIGLNQRQGMALENYRSGLIASGTTKPQVTKLTESFRDKQLAFRADMIARTEMMNAVNHGHLEGQFQAREEGLFGNAKGFKEWQTAPEDGRLCPTCRAMHGVRVGLDQKFKVTLYTETKSGIKSKGTVYVDTPPVHPHCRCTHLLRLVN